MKQYDSYKDSGEPWLGDVPSCWESWKISHAFTKVGSGTTPESGNPRYHKNGTINWLNTGDLNNGILHSCAKKITPEALEDYSSLKLYPKGSLVIAMYGATIGKTSLLDFETTTNQACCVFSESDEIDIKFLQHWFNGNKEHIINLAVGGGQPNISQDILKGLRIYCPTKEEQTQIANYLDHKTTQIDDLISKKEKLIELLKEERTAIINQAVTKGLNPDVPMKDSGIDWLGEIPEHWEVTRLKFLGDAIGGVTYSPNDIAEDDSGTLILRSSNIQNGKLSLLDNVYVNLKIKEEQLLRKGDILICSRNGSRRLIGKNITIDNRMEGESFGAFMMIFRSQKWNFLSKFFNSQIFSSQSGLYLTSTINQLTSTVLKNMFIAVPPDDDEINTIVKYLDKRCFEIDKTIKILKKEITLLKEYKVTLISEVVTGQVDVRDEKF